MKQYKDKIINRIKLLVIMLFSVIFGLGGMAFSFILNNDVFICIIVGLAYSSLCSMLLYILLLRNREKGVKQNESKNLYKMSKRNKR